jgi:hypothetical protein
MHVFKAREGGFTFRQTKMCELTYLEVRDGHIKKIKLFPEFLAKKMSTPKKLLQRAVKYFTAR